MDQRSICLFLAMKRLSGQAIYSELVAVLGPDAIGHSTVTNYLCQRHFSFTRRETIAWNPLGFSLIVALPKGCTFNAEYYRDNILAALTRLQPEDDGRKLVIHAGNAKAHITQKCRIFAKKMSCGSLPMHPTHLISHQPTSFCSVMSRNVSKEWCFHHTRNYSTIDAIGEVVNGIESETLTAVFERWMERLEWVSKNNGDYYP
jgi:methyl coenzyme M reductase subunit C